MTREYVLQGLSCANCAAKIERTVQKIEGVLSASINFATSKLRLDLNTDIEGIHGKIERIVHSHEPDVLVVEKKDAMLAVEQRSNKMRKIVWLSVGAVAFAVGIAFEWPVYINNNAAFVLLTFSYLLLGTKVILRALRNIARGKIFDENFLMAIATVGAFAIGEYAGAVAVMLFYQVGEFFQEMAVARSKNMIASLMDIRPDYANLQTDGQIRRVSPWSVNIGDVIVVKPGEKIPLDGIVIEGEAMLDTSALTGEAVPRRASRGDAVLSGCINQNGVLTIEVTMTFDHSTASKIIELVENAASKKATVETFITKFARYYTPVVVLLALLVAVTPPLLMGGDWHDWIYRSLVLLIISCPCALVLSVPLGFFGGIGASSKRGILVKGGNFLEALAHLDIVVFDKTGTLTKGVFKVVSLQAAGDFEQEELIEAAAWAEAFSNHPIALSILKEHGKGVDKSKLSDYEEIAGHGVSVSIAGKTVLAGNEKLMRKHGIEFVKSKNFGTTVYVAIAGAYAGCITIADELKPDSATALADLKAMGVTQTIMLTGDVKGVAKSVAAQVGIDEFYANLLPQDKVAQMEMLMPRKAPKKTLAFVGDGINDAPVLAMADVGVAMGALGSDAAIEAADVVLMTDEPAKLVEAIKIARFTKRVVWQNIIFSLGVQILFLFLGTMGLASIWEAIFADVGVALIAILNTMRILK